MSTEFMVNDDSDLFTKEEKEKAEKQLDPNLYYQDTDAENSIPYAVRTLSYSGIQSLRSCARRYQLSRMLPRVGGDDDDEHGHLSFGTIVGNGIQEYLISRDEDKAIFRAFLDWNDNLESERGLKKKKTFWHGVIAIQQFRELMDGPLANYDLAYFDGKPAVELGFRINCGSGFSYRGKLDALLIHRTLREFLPLECKTTGATYVHEAMYGNSDQGIGYGIVIDTVAASMEMVCNSYDVFYPVYMTSKQEWVPFRFPKNNSSRAKWLQSLLLDIKHVQDYHDVGYFPTNGGSCMSYGRECSYYGTCNMSDSMLLTGQIKKKLDKKSEYSLEFSMDDLIMAQLEKDVVDVEELQEVSEDEAHQD